MEIKDKVKVINDESIWFESEGIVDDFECYTNKSPDALVLVKIKDVRFWFFRKELKIVGDR